MTAREMTPERLEWLRNNSDHYHNEPEILELLAHADTITADRDEARAEVAALRAQRDEIREAHRVEVAAVTTRLLRAEADCVGASKRLSEVGNEAADREDELKGMLEALTSRLEAAERSADGWKADAARLWENLTAAEAARAEAQKPGGAWHVRLWDAINAYAAATSSRTSVARQRAVVDVEAVLRAPPEGCPLRKPTAAETIAALTARAEAAEREREDWRARAERAEYVRVDGLTQAAATTAALARADAAEAIVRELREAHAVFLAQRDQDRGEVASAKAKLAALVEAVKRFALIAMGTPGYFDAVGALYDEDELGPIADAARGEP